jgi:hypothetical protein
MRPNFLIAKVDHLWTHQEKVWQQKQGKRDLLQPVGVSLGPFCHKVGQGGTPLQAVKRYLALTRNPASFKESDLQVFLTGKCIITLARERLIPTMNVSQA